MTEPFIHIGTIIYRGPAERGQIPGTIVHWWENQTPPAGWEWLTLNRGWARYADSDDHNGYGMPPDETPVDNLYITVRASHVLRTAGVKTAGEIRALGRKGLLALPGLGRATLRDLETVVFAP